MMEIVLLFLRIGLATIFLTAGIGKLLDRDGSEKALRGFEAPEWSVRPLAALLPWIEIGLAVGFLFVQTSWFSAVGSVAMLTAFIAGMLYQMSKGNAPDCHCFGQIHNEPVSGKSILRNAGFILVAAIFLFSGSGNQGMDITGWGGGAQDSDLMQVFIGIAVVGFLLAIVVILKKISDQQEQIIRRIEILEVISSEGKEVTREGMTDPHAGLPLGSPLPEFAVNSLHGEEMVSTDLAYPGKPALLMFVSPTCHPCESLIPDINEWVANLGEELDVVLISSGTVEENIEKFGIEHSSRIFLQQERDVSDLLGTIWTPTAILLDGKGRIKSRNAVGDSAIRDLVESVRTAGLEDEYFFFANGDADSLLIGMEIPDFSLTDLEGREYTEADIRGRQTLAAFWSTTCPFCINMIEDLKEWNRTKGEDAPQLVLFSDGDPEQHKALDLDAPILLEKDYKTAAQIGMNGTPSAILIDEHGRIISETGLGAEKIWTLLGRQPAAADGEAEEKD